MPPDEDPYDSEVARRGVAELLGLDEKATWEEIYAAREVQAELTNQRFLDHSEERRKQLAKSYGLLKDADWDDIYSEWKKEWGYGTMALRIGVVAAIPVGLILFFSTHWIAILACVLIVVVIVFFGVLTYGLSAEDHYHGFVRQHPEIEERAKKDQIYT